jgi:hypothetical protein
MDPQTEIQPKATTDAQTEIEREAAIASQSATESKAAMEPQTEKFLKALEFFKDWSNYLLVTTVAALGWVAASVPPPISPALTGLTLVFLAASVMFAIFTLALIPIVAEMIAKGERISREIESFYDVKAKFTLWPYGRGLRYCKLKWVCWWQHVFFLAGIIVYTLGRVQSLFTAFPYVDWLRSKMNWVCSMF